MKTTRRIRVHTPCAGTDFITSLYFEIQVTRSIATWNSVGSSTYRQVVEIGMLQEKVTLKIIDGV